MEAKEFLKTVYWSEKEVNSLRNELRQVEATLLSSPDDGDSGAVDEPDKPYGHDAR